jgi:hypothetical protein
MKGKGTWALLPAAALMVMTAACGAAGSAPAPSSAAAVRAWVVNGGKAKMSLVSTDMDIIARDASPDMAAILVTDGAQLAKDATAAGGSPMPCAVTDYTTAMRTLAAAGADLALGNVPHANAELQAAVAPLTRAIDAYNQALGLGTQ